MWDDILNEYGRRPIKLMRIRVRNRGHRIDEAPFIWMADVRATVSVMVFTVELISQAFCVWDSHSSVFSSRIIEQVDQNRVGEMWE